MVHRDCFLDWVKLFKYTNDHSYLPAVEFRNYYGRAPQQIYFYLSVRPAVQPGRKPMLAVRAFLGEILFKIVKWISQMVTY